MLTTFYISIGITALVTVVVRMWFGDSGLGAFPVLSFLVIAIASYALTSLVSGWIS